MVHFLFYSFPKIHFWLLLGTIFKPFCPLNYNHTLPAAEWFNYQRRSRWHHCLGPLCTAAHTEDFLLNNGETHTFLNTHTHKQELGNKTAPLPSSNLSFYAIALWTANFPRHMNSHTYECLIAFHISQNFLELRSTFQSFCHEILGHALWLKPIASHLMGPLKNTLALRITQTDSVVLH